MNKQGPSFKKASKVENSLLKIIDVDSRAIGSGLQELYHRIGSMESDNNPDAEAKESSAKGVYQYLTDNGKDGKGSSFQVGLNRLKRAFKKAGEDVPKWVADAEKHKDPRKLTRQQSNELLLADLVLTPRKSRKYLQDFLVKGDDQALANLYAEVHHTDTKQNDNVETRMEERLLATPSGGMNGRSQPIAPPMAGEGTQRPSSLQGNSGGAPMREDPLRGGHPHPSSLRR